MVYYVLLNGEEIGPIIPHRGLRQGDPLSQYLFILAQEGLSAVLRKQEQRGNLHGISVAKGAPRISHLFFADDCYLFFQANEPESLLIKDILQDYASSSGQQINYGKSSIFFSRNVKEEDQNWVKVILGISGGDLGSTYLGLPSLIGRRKKQILGFIRSKIISRINGWNNKFLSRAGREILLKNIIQAIPTYAMSVFLLPKELCNEIEIIMNSYWWGCSARGGKGIKWMSWNKLSVPKQYGGMGFRTLHEFNLALLGKQAWRLIQNTNSLVSRVFRAKYYPNDSFLEAKLGGNPSFIWRSIWETQEIMRRGIHWRIGDGKTVRVWSDPWLPCNENAFIQTEPLPFSTDITVNSLRDSNVHGWDRDILNDIFNKRDRNLILSVPLSNRDTVDSLFWRGEENGNYSVRSCYKMMKEHLGVTQQEKWTYVWKLNIPPKVKAFLWQACTHNLLSTDNLRRRRVDIPPTCVLCSTENESTLHPFESCTFTRRCWSMVRLSLLPSNGLSFPEWVSLNFSKLNDDTCSMFVMICWSIWKARNAKIWENEPPSLQRIVNSAGTFYKCWCDANGGGAKEVIQTSRHVIK